MSGYLHRHLQALFGSAGAMLRAPAASLMTMAVIGITLALPVILYLLVDNMQAASRNWQGRAQLTLYLKQDLSTAAQHAFVDKLKARKEFDKIDFISPETALREFKRDSGLSAALNALPRNPLPATVVLYLGAGFDQVDAVARVNQELTAMDQVEFAQSDTSWVRRLHSILRLIENGVWVMASLLGFAVVVIVSNTIRLHVLNRRDEIEIIKLVGGSNAFIRRPFLYTGLLQGLGGAVLALLFVSLCMAVIHGPVTQLSGSYGTDFRLTGLRWPLILGLLAGGGALGWLASRWAVQRHLAQIEPH